MTNFSILLISTILLSGCSDEEKQASNQTTESMQFVEFPSAYKAILDSDLFLKPLSSVSQEPPSDFLIRESIKVLTEASNAWDSIPDHSMAGMQIEGDYDLNIKEYSISFLTKLEKDSKSVRIDNCRILAADESKLNQVIPIPQEVFHIELVPSLLAHNEKSVSNVVDAIKLRLGSNKKIIGLRVWSIEGNEERLTYQNLVHSVQTIEGNSVSV
jgi:hypothetical protein